MAWRGISIHVSGKVQGVHFRESTRSRARTLGIHGQVRNLTDGRVWIEAHGPADAMDEFIQWCKEGPPLAYVDDVAIEEIPVNEAAGGMVIR